MQINLTVKAGPHEGALFEFKERAYFIVGRSDRAHFRLPVKDKSISRIHFMDAAGAGAVCNVIRERPSRVESLPLEWRDDRTILTLRAGGDVP